MLQLFFGRTRYNTNDDSIDFSIGDNEWCLVESKQELEREQKRAEQESIQEQRLSDFKHSIRETMNRSYGPPLTKEQRKIRSRKRNARRNLRRAEKVIEAAMEAVKLEEEEEKESSSIVML